MMMKSVIVASVIAGLSLGVGFGVANATTDVSDLGTAGITFKRAEQTYNSVSAGVNQ